MKIDNLSHSNQTFEILYISHLQMQAVALFKNIDFFPTKSQNFAWQPPKPLRIKILEFIHRGCHRTKFFACMAARLLLVAANGTQNFRHCCLCHLAKEFYNSSLTFPLKFTPLKQFIQLDEGLAICVNVCKY